MLSANMSVMPTKARQVLREALALSPKARADIARTLLRSLDASEEPGVDAAWAVEVERRLHEIESGEAKLIPWERVRRRLEATVGRGRKKRQVPPGGRARFRGRPSLTSAAAS
jgi:putative addiction module component (TIGR02574 family)